MCVMYIPIGCSNRGARDVYIIYIAHTVYVHNIGIFLLLLYDTHRAGLNERALLPIIPSKTSQYTYIIYCVPLPREMFWADRRICYIIYFFLV